MQCDQIKHFALCSHGPTPPQFPMTKISIPESQTSQYAKWEFALIQNKWVHFKYRVPMDSRTHIRSVDVRPRTAKVQGSVRSKPWHITLSET